METDAAMDKWTTRRPQRHASPLRPLYAPGCPLAHSRLENA